jgi:hypothetical protein
MKEIKAYAGISFSFVFAFAAAATGLVGSCGGDDKPSESDYKAACVQVCNKSKECNPEFAGLIDCNATCTPKPGSGTNETGEGCSNGAEILAKGKECLAKSCMELEACLATIPDCQGGGTTPATGGTTGNPGLPDGGSNTGRGGTTGGAGGTTGSADAGSTAGCEECVRAQMCLEAAAADAGAPGGGLGGQNYGTVCAMATGAARDQIVPVCRAVVASVCR